MKHRLRAALLLGLAALALSSAAAAVGSIRPAWERSVPQEVYAGLLARAGQAAYTLRCHEGRVAVYAGEDSRSPREVTAIEAATLRLADRAMLEKGIPAGSLAQLLCLLEDLGP